MRGVKGAIFVMVFYVCFVTVPSAGSINHESSEKQAGTWDLIRKAQAKKADIAEKLEAGRVIHFPEGCSLGRLLIQDSNFVRDIETFFFWISTGGPEWEYLGKATGDIIVPAGKRLAFEVNQDVWKDLSFLSELRPDDIYRLIVFGPYPDGPMPDDRIMPHIARLTGLKELRLGNTNISARGLKYIVNLKSLERLDIGNNLTNGGMAQISQLPKLKCLYIVEHRLTNTGLSYISKLNALEELSLSGGPLSDSALAYIAKLPSLKYLLLSGDNFTDDGMAYIKNNQSLRILHFGNLNRLTDEALFHLSQMPRLERLALHYNRNITDAGIVHLTKLKSLKMLDIYNSQITDEGLAHLAKIESLENLTLPGASVTDAGVEHIAQLHDLRHLWIVSGSSSPLTDKSLFYIGTLENLKKLSIGGTSLTDKGMKHIAKLVNLKELTIFSADLTNNGLAELTGLDSLKDFYLGRGTNVSISGLKSLNSLRKLQKLTLYDIRQDGSVMDISGLAELDDLGIFLNRERKGGSIVSDSFKNEDWVCLANLTKLNRLRITGVGIDDEGVKHLSGLTNLEFLNIICPGESRITDEAFKYLSNMDKLNRLYIKDGCFTDKALDYLDEMPSLTTLELTSDDAFSNRAIREFQQKNPDITRLILMP